MVFVIIGIVRVIKAFPQFTEIIESRRIVRDPKLLRQTFAFYAYARRENGLSERHSAQFPPNCFYSEIFFQLKKHVSVDSAFSAAATAAILRYRHRLVLCEILRVCWQPKKSIGPDVRSSSVIR